jgi:hypothetical protein
VLTVEPLFERYFSRGRNEPFQFTGGQRRDPGGLFGLG